MKATTTLRDYQLRALADAGAGMYDSRGRRWSVIVTMPVGRGMTSLAFGLPPPEARCR